MKNYIIILFCVLQGCSSTAQNDACCERNSNLSADFLYEYMYFTTDDILKLDTALLYVELAITCCPRKSYPNLIGRKLGILSLMRNYDAGIEFIPTLTDQLLTDLPYYNSVLLKRFYAMKSLYEGDTVLCNQYVYSIIEEIAPFITEHQETIDSLCKNDLSTILKDYWYVLCFAQIQYYYYKSIVESADILYEEFNLLRQKGYDLEYIDDIKRALENDFLFYQLY